MKKISTLILILIFATIMTKLPLKAQSPTNPEAIEKDIREKVKDKVESAISIHKAYIGSVTDKTGDSLQIKNIEGEIQLVSINPNDVGVAKITKTTTNIKFSDVAIGDFVVVMGTKNGNGVLTARRVLVIDPLEEPKRKILFATVVNIVKKEITIKDLAGAEQTLTFPARWKGPEIKEINEGDKVIVVSIEDEGKNLIRTIQIISSPTPSPEE